MYIISKHKNPVDISVGLAGLMPKYMKYFQQRLSVPDYKELTRCGNVKAILKVTYKKAFTRSISDGRVLVNLWTRALYI